MRALAVRGDAPDLRPRFTQGPAVNASAPPSEDFLIRTTALPYLLLYALDHTARLYARPAGVPGAQALSAELAPYLDAAYSASTHGVNGSAEVPDDVADRAATLLAATAERLTTWDADPRGAQFVLFRLWWLSHVRGDATVPGVPASRHGATADDARPAGADATEGPASR